MDEPSAALSGPEAERLHEIVRGLRASGKTIVLISHFLDEVLSLADSVTVLRDGRVVESLPVANATEQSLVEAMLGRPFAAAFPLKQPAPADAPVVLSVRNLVARGVADASLEVRRGEIVGLAGPGRRRAHRAGACRLRRRSRRLRRDPPRRRHPAARRPAPQAAGRAWR